MDFVIVTKTCKDTTVFVHLSTDYLNVLQVADEKEYRQSICVTLFDDEESALSKLQTTNFARLSGKSVFEHPRTKRSACIKFLTNMMKLEENTIVYYTCVFEITWQETSHVADTLKKCKTCRPQKQIERGGVKYLACPISTVFDNISADSRKIARECMMKNKCLFGINVAYQADQGIETFRSLLVPMAMFNASMHSPSLSEPSLSNFTKLQLW